MATTVQENRSPAALRKAFRALGDDADVVAKLLAMFIDPNVVADLTGAEVSDDNRCPERRDRFIDRAACGCIVMVSFEHSATGAATGGGMTFPNPCACGAGWLGRVASLIVRLSCDGHSQGGDMASAWCEGCAEKGFLVMQGAIDRQQREADAGRREEWSAEAIAERAEEQQRRIAEIGAVDPEFVTLADCGCRQRWDPEADRARLEPCLAHASRFAPATT